MDGGAGLPFRVTVRSTGADGMSTVPSSPCSPETVGFPQTQPCPPHVAPGPQIDGARQTPAAQTPPSKQGSPSSQAIPSAMGSRAHAPAEQVATWQLDAAVAQGVGELHPRQPPGPSAQTFTASPTHA